MQSVCLHLRRGAHPHQSFDAAFFPESHLPAVRLPESFRGGCSFGVRAICPEPRHSPTGITWVCVLIRISPAADQPLFSDIGRRDISTGTPIRCQNGDYIQPDRHLTGNQDRFHNPARSRHQTTARKGLPAHRGNAPCSGCRQMAW